jgi:hypothetical protein
MAPIWPVLHRLSCSNEIVRNASKHEFCIDIRSANLCGSGANLWVEWGGSAAFVVKNSDLTLFSELVR